MSKLLLIDGNAVLHRAYHALPPLTTKTGDPVNAVYGFISMLLRLVTDLKPTHVAVCFDTPKPTFRHSEYVGYQANRPRMDSDLGPQFQIAYDVLTAMQIPIYKLPGYEADDVIGTVSTQAKEIEEVNLGSSLMVSGKLVLTPERAQSCELQVRTIELFNVNSLECREINILP